MSEELPGLGHNLGPTLEPVVLRDQLAERYAKEIKRIDELIESANGLAGKIESEEEAGKASNLVLMLRGILQEVEASRKKEKKVYDALSKEVQGFFTKPMDRAKAAMNQVLDKVDVFSKWQAEQERIAREERAKAEREEAERLRKEAEDAERKRREAEERRLEEERRAEEARLAKERAKEEEREAKRRAEEARQREREEQRLAEQRKREREAEAKAQAEADAKLAAQREAQAKADEERAAKARQEREQAEKEATEARERAKEARAAQRASEQIIRDSTKTEKLSGQQGRLAVAQVHMTDKRAGQLQRRAEVGQAELSRIRSDLGAVASQAEYWDHWIEDVAKIPPAQLWPYFSEDEVKAAVARYVRSGGRLMPGVKIERTSKARIV